VVSLKDVTFVHEGQSEDSASLRSASLSIREGERVAVVGKMGSGKTTMLRLIMRLLEPTSGSLELRGVPYESLRVDDVRRAFGYVPQGAALFDRSVLENAFYGVDWVGMGAVESTGVEGESRGKLEKDRLKAFWKAAKELGVDGVLEALQDGAETRAGKAGSRLSGGQRQAVWLVRMRLLGPAVLVLDEPTSAMDPESRAAVSAAIARFPTVIFVTHDMGFVDAVATRRISLADGEIVADSSSGMSPSGSGSSRVGDSSSPASSDDYVIYRRADPDAAGGASGPPGDVRRRRAIVDEGLVGSVRYSYLE
jgi:ATP-binding cassette subfamily C protein LapB